MQVAISNPVDLRLWQFRLENATIKPINTGFNGFMDHFMTSSRCYVTRIQLAEHLCS